MTLRPVLLLLLLAACADPRAEREAAAARFIGQPESVLLRERGVPARTADSEGHRFLAYVERMRYFRQPVSGLPWRAGLPTLVDQPELVELVCETTFEIAAGKVVEARLHGNGCG